MAEGGIQVCPVCNVKILKIIGGDRVLFAAGPPGTREILWQKVCRYTEKPGCVNRDRGNGTQVEG